MSSKQKIRIPELTKSKRIVCGLKTGASRIPPLIKPAPAVAPNVMSKDLRRSGFCQYSHTASGISTNPLASQAEREKLTTNPAAISHQVIRMSQELTLARPRINPTARKAAQHVGVKGQAVSSQPGSTLQPQHRGARAVDA